MVFLHTGKSLPLGSLSAFLGSLYPRESSSEDTPRGTVYLLLTGMPILSMSLIPRTPAGRRMTRIISFIPPIVNCDDVVHLSSYPLLGYSHSMSGRPASLYPRYLLGRPYLVEMPYLP